MVSGQEFLARGWKPPDHVLTQGANGALGSLCSIQGTSPITGRFPRDPHLTLITSQRAQCTPGLGLQPVRRGCRHTASDRPAPEAAWGD